MPNLNDFAILSNSAVGKRIPDDFANSEMPKFKFNFFLQFKFRSSMRSVYAGGNTVESNAFAVRQMGRPTPIVQYQDANYYGFRTKVATKTDFSVFNVSFYDDALGRAHNIFETYMSSISSIVNISNANQVPNGQTIIELPEGDFLGPIEHVDLVHFHMQKRTVYRFHNPKITNFLLDELDMTQSEVAAVTMSFIYDGFHILESPGGPAP